MTDTIPAHLDCPACPHCSAPCGCPDEVPAGWLRCGACGDAWQATPAELRKAARALAAYEKVREAEEQAERDAEAVARLPAKLREVNRRLLAHRDVKPDNAEQLDLLGGAS